MSNEALLLWSFLESAPDPYITKIIERKYQEGLYLPPIQGENKKRPSTCLTTEALVLIFYEASWKVHQIHQEELYLPPIQGLRLSPNSMGIVS